MSDKVFFGLFGDREDLLSQFDVSEDCLQGVNFLWAAYSDEGYCGDALVIFEKDGKLYEVNGGHCSCNGLEDQWDPEETSWEALSKRDTESFSWHGFGPEALVAFRKLIEDHK